MKKVFLSLLFLTMSFLFANNTQAAEPMKVKIEGSPVYFPDAQPYISTSNRTMVPIRFVSEKMGYQVSWTPQEPKLVKISNNNTNISFVFGSSQANVNGKTALLDSPVSVINDRTYVPIRFVSETFGKTVLWDPKYSTVELYSKIPLGKSFSLSASAYSASGGALDYMGNHLSLGTVAVDPKVIPLGTKLFIQGYHFEDLPSSGLIAYATDIGGSIKGNKIDIYIPVSPQRISQFGIQQVQANVMP